MSNNTSAQTLDLRRIETPVIQVFDSFGSGDNTIDDYVYIGGFSNLQIDLSAEENETDPSADCLYGDTASEPSFEATFDLLADKNPWFIHGFMSRSNNANATEGITLDTPVTGFSEDVICDYPVGDGEFMAVASKFDWDIANTGGYVSNLVVVNKTQGNTTLTIGTDFTLTKFNGKTAVKSIQGVASISEGDVLGFAYDYTPATKVVAEFQGERLLDTQTVVFHDLVDLYNGDTKESIVFQQAEFLQALTFAYKNCTDRDSITPSSVTVRSKSGSKVQTCYEWKNN